MRSSYRNTYLREYQHLALLAYVPLKQAQQRLYLAGVIVVRIV